MGFFILLQRGEMAVGKNKGLKQTGLKIGGKKGAKKKIVDPFTRKDWYDIKAPANFKNRDIGKTLVNRTQGTKIASDGLKGRVFEVSLADLQKEEAAERSFRKFRFICDDVQGKNCLCSFYGMSLTSDKLKGVVKKWQSLIECYVDAKTTDGYIVRLRWSQAEDMLRTVNPDPEDPRPHDQDHHPRRELRHRQGAGREADPRLHRRLHPQEVPVHLPHAGGPHPQGQGPQEAQAGQGQADGGARGDRRQGHRPQDRRDRLQAQVRAQGSGVCLNIIPLCFSPPYNKKERI